MTITLTDLLGEGSTTSLPSDKPVIACRQKAVKKSKSTNRKGSLSDYCQVFREKWEVSKDRMLYHLEHCPVHTDPDGDSCECCVMQYGSGKLGAHCKHSTEYHWQYFRPSGTTRQFVGSARRRQPETTKDRPARKDTQVVAIIKLLAPQIKFFTDQLNEAYARIDYGDYKKIYRLESNIFALFVGKCR